LSHHDDESAVKQMCLGIPMQVKEIDGFMARCAANGVEREVSLFMLPENTVHAGDYVIVHVGYAIQKITAQEARSAWELYDDMLRLDGELAADTSVSAIGQQTLGTGKR
jgi:hydrogenase expression/formation protein HypC